ncbi:MAG: transcriptional regulator [Herpetosiphonaceae bacterium]|nr:MAG: transcriptional regulator [Herpetosiphonaceae bacterium]
MSNATILCIDDDAAGLAALVQRFETAGYTVLKTRDFDHGYILFEENNPDLVTLEVGLQGERGWDLLERLAAAGGRVLVISSHGLVEDVVRGLETGAIDYITKPYRTEEVLARARLRLQHSLPLQSAMAPPAASAAGSQRPPQLAAEDQDEAQQAEVGAPSPSDLKQHAKSDEIEDQAAQSLGARLRSARRQRNISLVQAELETRIRMYYIQALEEERFALLPRGPATERIIREYARFLGLNPQHAVAEYRRVYRASDEPVHDLGAGDIELPGRGARVLLWLIAALLALAVTAGALLYFAPNEVEALWNNTRTLIFPESAPTPMP